MLGSDLNEKVTDAVANALDSLRDLEKNTADAVEKMRSSVRLEIRMKVLVQPGNACERTRFRVEGLTGDISSGGCQVLSPVPLRVGDVYFLSFERKEGLELPSVYARCMRSRVIREEAYEAGFAFFTQLQLPEPESEQGSDGLLV